MFGLAPGSAKRIKPFERDSTSSRVHLGPSCWSSFIVSAVAEYSSGPGAPVEEEHWVPRLCEPCELCRECPCTTTSRRTPGTGKTGSSRSSIPARLTEPRHPAWLAWLAELRHAELFKDRQNRGDLAIRCVSRTSRTLHCCIIFPSTIHHQPSASPCPSSKRPMRRNFS